MEIKHINFRESITKNDTIQIDCQAFTLHNHSENNVVIDNRLTLPPGGVIEFSLPKGEKFFQKINIRFEGTGKKLVNLIEI